MNVDVAVVGSPSFDLVFEGLPRLPASGEEILGRAFHPAPGSTAIQAIGMVRLGLSVTLVSPRGSDIGGRFLRDILDAEGVSWAGAEVPATPTTAVLSVADGAAMATAWAEGEPRAEEVEAVGASMTVLSLGRARLEGRPKAVRSRASRSKRSRALPTRPRSLRPRGGEAGERARHPPKGWRWPCLPRR